MQQWQPGDELVGLSYEAFPGKTLFFKEQVNRVVFTDTRGDYYFNRMFELKTPEKQEEYERWFVDVTE